MLQRLKTPMEIILKIGFSKIKYCIFKKKSLENWKKLAFRHKCGTSDKRYKNYYLFQSKEEYIVVLKVPKIP